MAAVLIVDDSPTVRMDLTDVLEGAGYHVIACGSAGEARSTLRTQTIELAILAVALPDGDGIDLLEAIRRDQVLGKLPVLVLASPEDVSQRVGAQIARADYLGRPYAADRVLARVRELIGSPPARDVVLIVDSDELFRARLAEALAHAGFATALAASGQSGLEAAVVAHPAVIAVDGAMSDIDGTSVVRRLRLEPALRSTPCLLLTNAAAKDAEVRALDAGADGYVGKSDLDLVVARIRALQRLTTLAPPLAEGVLRPKRILTVDDDREYLEVLAGRLHKRGYDVIAASSGEEAIATLAREAVDCILLDRSMAGMGGVATCKHLKQDAATRDTPLIILTASEQRDAVIEGLAAGADDFVSKASGFDVLAARVQAQIRRKQIEDEQRAVREQLLRSELEAAEARSAKELAETRAVLAEELERANEELAQANRELEAFSYSVSHDLRAPLRTISAFTQALVEDMSEAFDDRARDYTRRVLAASARMSDLIEALLELARISRAPLGRHRVDLSSVAGLVVEDLVRRDPERTAVCNIARDLVVEADGRLMRILLENLIGNAWKFTARQAIANIDIGVELRGEPVFFVRDNGAGFEMSQAARLFTPFHRLHPDSDFGGTGIGLATVRRIVERHGGRIWAEGAVGAGAKISFTVPPER